jgi:putative oxidoreductase
VSVSGVESTLLLLRLVAGSIVAVHGAQKLFGWFGGHGLFWTTGLFAGIGVKAPRALATTVGIAELGGGVLFALGFLIPLAALAIAFGVSLGIGLAVRPGGSVRKGHASELDLLLLAAVVGVAASSAGPASLDALSGSTGSMSGVSSALAILALSAAGATGTLALGTQPQARRSGAATAAGPNGSTGLAETWYVGRCLLSRQPLKPQSPSAERPQGRNTSPLAIGVANAAEGSALIAWLWNRGFCASLSESPGGWTVDVRSSAEPRRLLLDVAVALDGWLAERTTATLQLRTAERGYVMRLSSGK